MRTASGATPSRSYRSLDDHQGELRALALLVVIRKKLADRPLHERLLVLAREGEQEDVAMSHLQWADALLEAGLGGAAIRELEHAAMLLRAQGSQQCRHAGTGRDKSRPGSSPAWRQRNAPCLTIRPRSRSYGRLDDLEGLYQCTNGLAAAYAEIGRWDLARTQFDAAVAVARRLGTPRLIDEAMSAGGLGGAGASSARRRPPTAPNERRPDRSIRGLRRTRSPTSRQPIVNFADFTMRMTAVERALELARTREMSDAEAQALLERAQLSDAAGPSRGRAWRRA